MSLAAGKVSYLFETMNRLKESFPIDSSYLTVLIKIIGITYIGQLSSAICKDAGYQNDRNTDRPFLQVVSNGIKHAGVAGNP